MFYYIKTYWKSFLVLIMIFYLSFASPSKFDGIKAPFLHTDKIIHFAMYAFLATVLSVDFFTQKKQDKPTIKYVSICIIFPILIGGIVELVQKYFFRPRSGDWLDWLSDIAGVLFIMLIIIVLKKKKT